MKEFPVDTATACQLKWTWSTIMLNRGTTSSCHRVRQDTLTPENFLNFHNTPKKLNDRQLMLEGKRPAGGCEYCYKIEDAGGTIGLEEREALYKKATEVLGGQ
jgi:hypothetical protein